mgnify:CR=1 FL=1
MDPQPVGGVQDDPPVTELVAEPFDLVAAMPGFGWPTVVISGGRDLITPPAIAQRVAGLIPDAVLLELPSAGHSVLDMRESAALTIAAAVCAGEYAGLPDRATELDNVPPDFTVRLMVKGIATAAAAESLVPAGLPRAIRQLRTW